MSEAVDVPVDAIAEQARKELEAVLSDAWTISDFRDMTSFNRRYTPAFPSMARVWEATLTHESSDGAFAGMVTLFRGRFFACMPGQPFPFEVMEVITGLNTRANLERDALADTPAK